MTAILYPVAETPEAAMHAPRGYAAREREAAGLAGGAVRFVTEQVGPSFLTRDAALDAYAGRIEDGRAGRSQSSPPPEMLWGELVPVAAHPPSAPRRPTYARGRRWPQPTSGEGVTRWRLAISYWRLEGEAAPHPHDPPEDPARKLRRTAGGRALDGAALNALARQPLAPMRPQQPLDIGLFETRLPESPDIIVPDE